MLGEKLRQLAERLAPRLAAPLVIVEGGAGMGKTVLARRIEKELGLRYAYTITPGCLSVQQPVARQRCIAESVTQTIARLAASGTPAVAEPGPFTVAAYTKLYAPDNYREIVAPLRRLVTRLLRADTGRMLQFRVAPIPASCSIGRRGGLDHLVAHLEAVRLLMTTVDERRRRI